MAAETPQSHDEEVGVIRLADFAQFPALMMIERVADTRLSAPHGLERTDARTHTPPAPASRNIGQPR